jgi:RNA polymerase sigma factor (sigma-70 family)
MNSDADESELPPSRDVVERLVENHREFLRFVESRVRDRAAAEDILQAAFVRSIEKADQVRSADSVVAWFYRLLRNAIVDHYRRTSVAGRRVDPDDAASELAYEPELKGIICACMDRLVPTLKPEYAEVVRRVDLGEEPLADVASSLGITANNAAVRLHRARQGLKKQLERSCGTCATHGCLDCRCGSAPPSGPPSRPV